MLIGIPSRDPFLVVQFLERHSVSFGSTHEEIDATSSMSSCDDAMLFCDSTLLIVTGYMNSQEDIHRG